MGLLKRAGAVLRSALMRLGGRRWWRLHPHRMLVAPRVGQSSASGDDAIEVRVDGMMCSVCAVRTGSALAALPGVVRADVDLDRERAVLRLAPGAQFDATEAQRALDHVVVASGARRMIERCARALRRAGRSAGEAQEQENGRGGSE